ncbi:flagellar hook-length control protein FliK [Duganella sp. CF458]|uniref:flagellar hook-length control protein FliK n=1 Tax=Duganella sp. CF458 TaxID=1884368 RepID=UPI0008EA56C9|nr:flagellar hook-length control protein FliK [Duganella sp. CF458]SFF75481.1 flagellar hook-length control protein FliK [Duganella sp. CF458]
MIKLPAAPAATVPPATGASGLPPPAANGTAASDAAPAGAATDSAAPANAVAGALHDVAVALAPAPFGALLDAMAGDLAEDESAPAGVADDQAAAAQAVATMLPAMGNLPLPGGAPGATPDSVAAVAAALTAAPAIKPAANDSALLLRQQAQASALAARGAGAGAGAQREVGKAPEASLLDTRAAMLAAAARPVVSPVLSPVVTPALPAGTPAAATRTAAGEALAAALNALQGRAADSTAAPIAAKDSASMLADSQRQPSDAGALPGFRSVLANASTAQPGDAVQLSGSAEQWHQPLRAALGDRLQLQLARNDERAVIRLEPPNLGSVEISVRHSGGALQVNIAASHSEVLRQLNTIGEAVRQDLSQRQFGDVAVTVSASTARNLADGGQQQRQQEAQQQREQQRQPGRALEDGDAVTTTFAMLGERE